MQNKWCWPFAFTEKKFSKGLTWKWSEMRYIFEHCKLFAINFTRIWCEINPLITLFYIFSVNYTKMEDFCNFSDEVYILGLTGHTAYISIWMTKRQAISTDAFQACYELIWSQNKKNFSNRVEFFWDISIYPFWNRMDGPDKSENCFGIWH